MSGVALRCPVCGTTQSNAGECEACSEGQVRYFCDNHIPGVWLDGPVCTACGARFGDAPRKRPEPPPTVPPVRTTPTRSRPPSPRAAEPSRGDFGRPLPSSEDPEEKSAPTALDEFLAYMSAARERARSEAEARERRWPTEESPRRSIPLLGCLTRLAVIVLLFIVFALAGLFLLLGG